MGRKCHRFGGWNKWVTAEHCGNYTCCSHGSKVINLGANLSNFDSSQIGCFVLTGIELLVIGNWYGNSLVLLLHNYCLALISPCLSAASCLLHACMHGLLHLLRSGNENWRLYSHQQTPPPLVFTTMVGEKTAEDGWIWPGPGITNNYNYSALSNPRFQPEKHLPFDSH